MNLFAELKRRKVFKIGATYVLVAWLVVQVASIACARRASRRCGTSTVRRTCAARPSMASTPATERRLRVRRSAGASTVAPYLLMMMGSRITPFVDVVSSDV